MTTDARKVDPPAKQAAREELRRKRKIIQEILHLETAELVMAELRWLEITENSPAWNAALAAWREFHAKDF